jgi:hypothetical protein
VNNPVYLERERNNLALSELAVSILEFVCAQGRVTQRRLAA